MAVSIISNSDIVQVIRATVTKNAYNSEELDWSNPTVVAEGRASIQHFLGTEDDTYRQTTTEGLRFVSEDPNMADTINPRDRIVYAGDTYEVDGPVQKWRLFGKYHHIEFYIKRVVG